ncbi:MAG: hypothetical protein LAO31_07540 [Acidobacteriia bacterium]|nr:hypothetical protein [Terriglobia bacterium]
MIDGTPVPAMFADAINSVKVPEAENGWVVQVITRGGFNGAGRGDIAITSKGVVNCTPPHAKCRNELTPEALQRLAQIVTRAKPSNWGGSTVGNCMDCYFTVLALRRREADGKVRAYFVIWDDTTEKSAPFEAKALIDRVIALAR